MIKEIVLNGKRIEYELQRKNVKNINLRIKADKTVHVSANDRVPIEVIEAFMLSKSEQIIKALDRFENLGTHDPKPKEYIDGDRFQVFGHIRTLKIVKGSKNNVESDGTYITLTVTDPNDLELKKKLTDKWLNAICREMIQNLCDAVYPKFQKYGIEYPAIRYRNMVSRWGSCQPKSRILTFNYALVKAPIPCIEYVVVHEFTHFLEPNHSAKYYEKLAMFIPDWKDRKKLLEDNNINNI